MSGGLAAIGSAMIDSALAWNKTPEGRAFWDESMRKAQARQEAAQFGPCGCIGPQNGQPLCPCQMRGVQIKDGRYVRIQDLGPAPTGATS